MPETRPRPQAVPAYFHPHDGAADWARLATTTDVGLVVANISDGPGIVREELWAHAFGSVQATGCDVVGYVDTGYLGLTGLRTQRGSNLLDDWVEQILCDVAAWYRLYGDEMSGIFFDQVAESDDGASLAPVFRRLRDDVRHIDPDAVTVLNPGAAVPASFAGLSDVIVTFEGSYDDYLGEGPDAGFEPLSWRPGPRQKIWHMVHHTPDPKRAAEVVKLSRRRGADVVYVTDSCAENPYSSLPSTEMWTPRVPTRELSHTSRLPLIGWCRSPRRTQPLDTSAPTAVEQSSLTPDSTLISNPSLSRRHHVVEASADFVVASSARRVFVASHRREVPRWWTGSSPQIAADWMIENNRLYAYSGTGTDWTWTPSGEVTFEALGKTACWRVDASRIGLDHDLVAEAAFHVSAPGHREYSAVATGCEAPRKQASH
jgi:Spherulation-specific family 4